MHGQHFSLKSQIVDLSRSSQKHFSQQQQQQQQQKQTTKRRSNNLKNGNWRQADIFCLRQHLSFMILFYALETNFRLDASNFTTHNNVFVAMILIYLKTNWLINVAFARILIANWQGLKCSKDFRWCIHQSSACK